MRTLAFISIIVCTRNRGESFRQTVDSLFCRANLEEPNWELLVVETSKDRTLEICRDFERRFPGRFRFLTESRIGKSHALNRAIVEARGDILAFTDDDVLFTHDYVRSIRTVFTSFPVDAVQGRVVLDCEAGWPPWLDETYASMANYRDFGQEVAPLKGTLCGTNMIVRKQLFEQVGGFSPELGPGGIGVFEDTEISLRMRDRGHHRPLTRGRAVA